MTRARCRTLVTEAADCRDGWLAIGTPPGSRYRRLTFDSDTFVHLGAAGLALGDASRDDRVIGSLFTDTSAAGLIIGGVDQSLAKDGELTSGNQILDNYFHHVAAEYSDCAAIFVGYAQYTAIEHNQIDHVPYSGIAIGWGGWLERFPYLGPLSNYSRGNIIAANLVFAPMQVLVDGGGHLLDGAGLSTPYKARLSPAPVPSPLPPYTQYPPSP